MAASLHGFSRLSLDGHFSSSNNRLAMLDRIKKMIEQHLVNPIDEEVFRQTTDLFAREYGNQDVFQQLIVQAIKAKSSSIVSVLCECFSQIGVNINDDHDFLDNCFAHDVHIDSIRALVTSGAIVNTTCLINAACRGSVEVFQFFRRTLYSQSALTEGTIDLCLRAACRSGNHAVAEFLIKQGVDITREDEKGKHCIHEAYDEKIAKLLLDHGEGVNVIARSSKREKMDLLPFLCDSSSFQDETPIKAVLLRYMLYEYETNEYVVGRFNPAGKAQWISAKWNSERISKLAQYLISSGADITIAYSEDNSPLCIAARRGDLGLIRAIIGGYKERSGANITAVPLASSFLRHSLDLAGEACQAEVFIELVRFGADPKRMGKSGLTAFEVAMTVGAERALRQLEIVEMLSKEGLLKANDQDASGRTYLHQAAKVGNLVVFRRLIQLGGRVNIVDSSGNTPLHSVSSSTDIEGSLNVSVAQYSLSVAEHIVNNHLKPFRKYRADQS